MATLAARISGRKPRARSSSTPLDSAFRALQNGANIVYLAQAGAEIRPGQVCRLLPTFLLELRATATPPSRGLRERQLRHSSYNFELFPTNLKSFRPRAARASKNFRFERTRASTPPLESQTLESGADFFSDRPYDALFPRYDGFLGLLGTCRGLARRHLVW